MADFTVETLAEDVLAATYNTADAGGDSFTNDGRTFIHVKNGDASGITVTVTAQRTSGAVEDMGVLAKSDATGAVAANGDAFFGPFPVRAFNDGAGKAAIGYSAVTSVTVAIIRMPRG